MTIPAFTLHCGTLSIKFDIDIVDLKLLPHVNYIFHVKAWYDDTRFAIYTSDGIRTDAFPPELSSSHKVKEMSATSQPADVDYFSQEDELTVTWANVFRDAQAGIASFQVSIGNSSFALQGFLQSVAY